MSTSNPLFQNLVPAAPTTSDTSDKSATTFSDAMAQMGISSVFDIIRQPKQAFARQLSTLSDADGELAYDNALCYASQIGRSYREEVVSSGRSVSDVSQRSGVRALVDIGPSYPNLFKENWDQFCKVGAIEAMDGPVAYLGSLRRFAEQRIEGASDSPKRIPLSVRRPDLDKLVIDEQSTYQSIPMLELVNRVLTQGIDKYQVEKGDVRPVQELLAEKKHPFVFPYHFAHQQVSLGLNGDKPTLGQLNFALAVLGAGYEEQPVSPGNALELLSDLSPVQQRLLIQPPPYAELSHALEDNSWYSPIQSNIHLWDRATYHINVPEQPSVISAVSNADHTLISMRLLNGTQSHTVALRATSVQEGIGVLGALDKPYSDQNYGLCFRVEYHPEDNAGQEMPEDCHASLKLDIVLTAHSRSWIGRQLTVELNTGTDELLGRNLNADETSYLRDHLGIHQRVSGLSPLREVKLFCEKTGIDADQLQALIAQKDAFPKLSPNCPIISLTGSSNALRTPPSPMNYGAVFVNGNGSQDSYAPGSNLHQYKNALIFWTQSDSSALLLGNTSLDRFDRMQRIIRLQRWLSVPFAELDTLITSAMRAEGDANPGLHLNQNTLRMLGAYRYFNRHYAIGAEEFAGFVHDITPFASGNRVPLFDRVFNAPILFGTPLRLDQTPFTQTSDDAPSQKTINQLCAGLDVASDPDSFGLLAANVIAHVGPLKRSLTTVSALYRQARIAKLFGLNVSDCQYLLELLGGNQYIKACTTGALTPHTTEAAAQLDVLDILMNLDATVRWLKAAKVTTTKLRELLTLPAIPEPTAQLNERLQLLASEARVEAITVKQVNELDLPNRADGTAIDWHAQMSTNGLLEMHGFVISRELTLQDTDHLQLTTAVQTMIHSLGLATDVIAPTVTRVSGWLMEGLTRQQRLVEGFLQEHTGLLPEQALLAGYWAGVHPHELLSSVVDGSTDAEGGQPASADTLQSLQRIDQVAQALSWTNVQARATRTFIAHPEWLGASPLAPLTFTHLQLLKAYDALLSTLGQPEERLLGYLGLANTTGAKRAGKRQLALQAQTASAELAELLSWSESEVAVLTSRLPEQMAKTVAHIDWVRQCQKVALQTGLKSAGLLQACALSAESSDANWQAVGQAVMAATA